MKRKFRNEYLIPSYGLLTEYEFNRKKYNIGEHSYVGSNFAVWNSETKIGKYCSIANDVSIAAHKHPIHTLTSSPFFYEEQEDILNNEETSTFIKNNIIENNSDK